MNPQPTTATPTDQPTFARVTIIGVGLLGASLGLALKERGLARWVVGVGRGGTQGPSKSLRVALERGAIDEMATDPLSGVMSGGGSDLVVVCTPVRKFPEMFRAIAPGLKNGAVVTDVGSTKGAVMAWAADLPAAATFVGSHPMAGSEKRGPEWARGDLYEGAVCLLCAAADATGEAEKRVEAMWRAVGMKTMWLAARQHDQWVAKVSHLPHAAAFALVNAVVAGETGNGEACLEAAGKGFLDTTRVASSDVEMWTDIFLTNPTAVCAALAQYTREIETLQQAIAAGDEATIRKILSAAKQVRDAAEETRKTRNAQCESQNNE